MHFEEVVAAGDPSGHSCRSIALKGVEHELKLPQGTLFFIKRHNLPIERIDILFHLVARHEELQLSRLDTKLCQLVAVDDSSPSKDRLHKGGIGEGSVVKHLELCIDRDAIDKPIHQFVDINVPTQIVQ